MTDPILKALWEIEDGLSKECGHDLRRLVDQLKASQKVCKARSVNRTGKRLASKTGR